ncbi:MAG: hypothetical protein WAT39_25635 [Planctomycetota bacterium]
MRQYLFASTFALLAPVLVAQAVHRVGPGQHATIQSAIDVAAPGDKIEVAAGVYPSFRVGKSLTIAAEPSALVRVVTTSPIDLHLHPADRVHFAGLDIQAAAVNVRDGIISMERCTVQTQTGVRLVGSTLAMRWSSAGASQGSGVFLQDAHLHASDSSFSTAAGGVEWIEQAGVKLVGTSVCHLALCSLYGAWPATATHPWPSTGLLAATATASATRIWLVDCFFVGGYQTGGMLGPALAVPSVAVPRARANRCQATGPVIGALELGNVLGVHTPVDFQIGTTFTTRMLGEPGHPLLLYAGGEPQGVMWIPLVEQPALAFAGLTVLGAGFANAQGVFDVPLTVPNNPTLRHLQIWWRGLDLLQTPWQSTPAFVTIVQ